MTIVGDMIRDIDRRLLTLHDMANDLLNEDKTQIDAETVLIMTRYIRVDLMDLHAAFDAAECK